MQGSEAVRLHEHPGFGLAIQRAAEYFHHHGLRPAVIEKDYFVTEVLRPIARAFAGQVIFKGGTSLSKGWRLIERFSEDIDIFLDPVSVSPPLNAKRIDRELKRMRDVVGAQSGLVYLREGGMTIAGQRRKDLFGYVQRFGGPDDVQGHILLESGTASGREPTVELELSSYLAQYLRETGTTLGAEDESAFLMRLLHFRRTFVEKLFAVHSKVEILKRGGHPLRSYARHYYDLFQLAARPEVREMLASAEYPVIKQDYDEISRQYFARDYLPPTNMTFASSEALFPVGKLAESLRHDYEHQCQLMCFGAFPSWREVLARFEEIRHLL